jgi:hypothetical protein
MLARDRQSSDVIARALAGGVFASTLTESTGQPPKTCDDVARYSEEQFMIRSKSALIAGFTSAEREYIRRELDQFFSSLPTVAEGFQLNTWRGGPNRGQPKLPPPAKSLLERGLMLLDQSRPIPRLLFTDTGAVALRHMMSDRRFADPVKFAHVRQELGIDSGQSEAAE